MERGDACDVVVVGAGIVGASIAHHLARRGLAVTVIDRIGPAAAASGASDGAVSVASKRPGVMARLAAASLAYTAHLASPGGVLEGALHLRPSFFFSSGAAETAALDALVAKIGGLDGLVRVTGDGPGEAVLPGIGAEAERVVAISGEGHMLGHEAVRAYLATPGITRLWPARLLSWEVDAAVVRAQVETPDGRRVLRCAWLVMAAGVDTPSLLPALPVRPRAGHLFITDPALGIRLPGVLTAASYLVQKTSGDIAAPVPPVVIDPLSTGQYLIGSSREEHGDAGRLDLATIAALVRRAVSVWPALLGNRVLRGFVGVRAATGDGLPILGALPESPRIIVATGFEGDGICLSALAGREVADMIDGRQAAGAALAADLAALAPGRFAGDGGVAP